MGSTYLKSIHLKVIFLLITISTSALKAQIKTKTYTKQFSFKCDNDFFLLSGSDRYYTNGLFFDYSLNSKKSSANSKQINSFQLGQKIFTPYKRKITPGNVNEIDRPIAGFLYLDYTQKRFLNNQQFWSWGITPGVIGPMALGEPVQTGWHRIIGVKSKWDWIWDYQLKNEAGINVHFDYSNSILKRKKTHIQITPTSAVVLGTIMTNVQQSLLFQLGNFNEMKQSDQWGSNIGESPVGNNGRELFVFYQPSIVYQVYNGTIQGGLFRKNKGPITAGLERWVISNEMGITGSLSKYSATFKIIYQGREAATQRDSHIYGSVLVSAKFR